MSIWWASSAMLNEAARTSAHSSGAWEGHLLALYKARHGCRPLKNRKGGYLLQEVHSQSTTDNPLKSPADPH